MLSRNIFRRITPATFNLFLSTTAPQHVKQSLISTSRTTATCITNGVISRFYAQQVTENNLPVVEFDYVKRATSQNEVFIIDVREPDEIKELGKIPNSVNIPLGIITSSLALSEKEFKQTFNRAKPKENNEIIFYCMIGKRSGKAQQSALNLGFKNAKNYLGSWTDWASKTL